MTELYMYASRSRRGMIHYNELSMKPSDLTEQEISVLSTATGAHENIPYAMHAPNHALMEGSTRVLTCNMSSMHRVSVKDASLSNLPCNHRIKVFINLCAQMNLCINKCIKRIQSTEY